MCHAPTCISKAPAACSTSTAPRAVRPAHRTRTHPSSPADASEPRYARRHGRKGSKTRRGSDSTVRRCCAFASLPCLLLYTPCRGRATVLSRGESKWGKNGNPTRPRSSQHVVRGASQDSEPIGARSATYRPRQRRGEPTTPPRLGRNDSTARISMDGFGGVELTRRCR